jgi:hypothetical protein
MLAQRERLASPMLWVGVLLAYLAGTRWPLAPQFLYYFDSANFALALDRFNPAIHQPQPPGYPLFVGLARIIHWFVTPPEHVFLIAGLIGAAATVLLVWALGRDMFDRRAGILAAVLLVSDPVFWFGGITNQVRIFLALSAAGVALLAWRAITRPNQPAWLYATFAALAVAGGFRPALPPQLLPLVLWAWWRTGARPKQLAVGIAALVATAAPWLAVTVSASGGLSEYVRVLREYSDTQFQGSSALFGATAPSAYRMFLAALVWNLLGTAAWIWAAPFVPRALTGCAKRPKVTFLALAVVPPFLFSAFVHIGDPDQALASISILSVIGGAVLAAWTHRWGERGLRTAAACVLIVHTWTFFSPPKGLPRAASYRAVASVDRMTSTAIHSIESVRDQGSLIIAHFGSLVSSRQIAYYFPEDYVVVLPPAAGEAPQLYLGRQALEALPSGAIPVPPPGSMRVVCLLPWNATGSELPGWSKKGAVYYKEVQLNDQVQIGPHVLVIQKPSPGIRSLP